MLPAGRSHSGVIFPDQEVKGELQRPQLLSIASCAQSTAHRCQALPAAPHDSALPLSEAPRHESA